MTDFCLALIRMSDSRDTATREQKYYLKTEYNYNWVYIYYFKKNI